MRKQCHMLLTLGRKGSTRDAVRDAERGTGAVPDRPENPRAPTEQEARPGAARRAHRIVAGDAVEDRARAPLPDACRRCSGLRSSSASASSISSSRARNRPTVAVVRKKDRLRLPDRPGEVSPAYFFESLDFPVTDRRMEAYYAEFPLQAKPSEPHRHDGAELIYVLKGQLTVTVEDETHHPRRGRRDVFRFRRSAHLQPPRPLRLRGDRRRRAGTVTRRPLLRRSRRRRLQSAREGRMGPMRQPAMRKG